jgi:hypothetical protein
MPFIMSTRKSLHFSDGRKFVLEKQCQRRTLQSFGDLLDLFESRAGFQIPFELRNALGRNTEAIGDFPLREAEFPASSFEITTEVFFELHFVHAPSVSDNLILASDS